MTLEQLRIFVAVAERQHVTRAAEALRLAQSAASSAIAMLEARYGVRLFDRIGRRIELTEAGRVFLDEARAVLARAEAAERVLGAFGTLTRGSLTLHASQTIAGYWLPRHLVAFRRAHPQLDLRLIVGNTAQVAAAVASGAADLGFVEGAVDNPDLLVTAVARDRLVVVVGRHHPWIASPPRTVVELARGGWVLREPGSGTRSAFEHALAGLGVAPGSLHVELELPSNEAILAAVEDGLGATAISDAIAAAGLQAGRLWLVPFTLPERAFHVLRHPERHRSRAAAAFLAMVVRPRPACSPAADGRMACRDRL